MLSRIAKLQWGIGHQSLKTIYKGAIIPMLTYRASVWEEAIQKKKNINKLQRTQCLMNIKMSKTYRTVSCEASCVTAGVKPICIKIDEIAKIYRATHGMMGNDSMEHKAPHPIKLWQHPADSIVIRRS